MEDKKLVIPAPVGEGGDDVATWALPEGAIARLGQGLVETLAFSPDGQYLAVGTRVGLWLYEVATMDPVALWATERGVFGTTFSPDGKWIATCDWDDLIKVWDVQRGVCLTHIETALSYFTFSSDSRWLATSDSDTATIYLWHPETGELFKKYTAESQKGGGYMPIAFSPDFSLIVSTGRVDTDNNAESIIVWNVESGEQVACLTGHTGSIYRLCFSPCGGFFTAGGEEDGTAYLWDVVNEQQITSYTGSGASCMIPSYSPEGILRATEIACSGAFEDNTIITVWDLEGDEKLYTAEESVGGRAIVNFSSGSRLAHESEDGGIKVWHLGKPDTQKSDYQPLSFSNFVAFSSDGKTLVAEYRRAGGWVYPHGDVLFWDLASKCPSRAIETEPVGTEQFFYTTSDGKPHVVSLDDGTVRLWEVDDHNVLIAEFTGHENRWKRAALTPTGDRLACMDEEGTLIAWDIQTIDKLCQFTHIEERFPNAKPATLEFSPDGQLLLSETNHWPSARLWDVENGEEVREFPSGEIGGIMGLWDCRGFSPCGSFLACTQARTEERSGNETICLWDVKQKEILMASPFRDAWRYAYSPCSSYLAWGGDPEEGLLLWDLKRREIYRRIPLQEGCCLPHSLIFSSCGEYLAYGSHWKQGLEKVPIHLWAVETGKHIVTFWGHPTDVQGLAFSPNNELLASASFDGSILLWDLTPYL